MGLNDEREKIKQAWDWMEGAPFDSEHYQAAYEFLDDQYVLKHFDLEQYNRLKDLDWCRWRDWFLALAGGNRKG